MSETPDSTVSSFEQRVRSYGFDGQMNPVANALAVELIGMTRHLTEEVVEHYGNDLNTFASEFRLSLPHTFEEGGIAHRKAGADFLDALTDAMVQKGCPEDSVIAEAMRERTTSMRKGIEELLLAQQV